MMGIIEEIKVVLKKYIFKRPIYRLKQLLNAHLFIIQKHPKAPFLDREGLSAHWADRAWLR
jgi:hypothetical protein